MRAAVADHDHGWVAAGIGSMLGGGMASADLDPLLLDACDRISCRVSSYARYPEGCIHGHKVAERNLLAH